MIGSNVYVLNNQRKMLAVLAQVMSQETNVSQEVIDLQAAVAAISVQLIQQAANLKQATTIEAEILADIKTAVTKLTITPINPADIETAAVTLQAVVATLTANNLNLANMTVATQTAAQQIEAAMNPPASIPAKP